MLVYNTTYIRIIITYMGGCGVFLDTLGLFRALIAIVIVVVVAIIARESSILIQGVLLEDHLRRR
jgi:hypothetical protein